MRLGLYTFATFTYITIIGGLAHTINSDIFIIELMGINFKFPIAVWVMLPVLFLFLFTLGHMIVYGLKGHFMLKKWHKDTLTLEDALYCSLVNEPKEHKYSLLEVENIALLLSKSSFDVSDNIEGLNPRLSRVVNMIQKIKNGEYIDLKEEKMSKVFHAGNPILIQNRLNRLERDSKFVEEVMRSSSEYSAEVQAQALEIFARKENFVQAHKYLKVFDVPNFLILLERVSFEDDLGLTTQILSDFIEALNLQCKDFVRVAFCTKKYFKPEENLLMFKEYQADNEKAQNAYLYLLFEYELIEQAGAYLDEQEENEFIKFRALYTLKQETTKYKLEDLIDIHSVCTESRHY